MSDTDQASDTTWDEDDNEVDIEEEEEKLEAKEESPKLWKSIIIGIFIVLVVYGLLAYIISNETSKKSGNTFLNQEHCLSQACLNSRYTEAQRD